MREISQLNVQLKLEFKLLEQFQVSITFKCAREASC